MVNVLDNLVKHCIYYICIRPDQLTVNIYEPGGGIPPHVDSHSPFEESIASLSLGSDIVIEFWPIHVGKKGVCYLQNICV